MLDAVQDRDTSVRDTMSKGRFVPGPQHPRIFGRGHIGRGHINPARGGRGGRLEEGQVGGGGVARMGVDGGRWKRGKAGGRVLFVIGTVLYCR